MKKMGLNEIREKYLEFFETKEHLRLKSFSLVPQNDKSLLLINSGMAPLKPYFTGQEIPPKNRVATCQKCIRTSDTENVGKTVRHGTFFEMLGNFSFGDYFKEEIIPWSWEFCIDIMGLPADKVFVSVYEEDDEAYDIWNKTVGLPPEKIFRMGKEDNFWEHGIGPCGPCSELYYDRGEQYGCGKEGCTVGCDCDRFMEFWNLVFTQFNLNDDGSYTRLKSTNIDTGMGLERMAVIMQDVASIFDVDTLVAIRNEVCRISNSEYALNQKTDGSIRIITDHIRSVTFMLADGVLPSNEGRGYVLRRLLRRAARHGKLLGIDGMFLTELSRTVIQVSKDAYPELEEKQDYIFKLLGVEESRFYETLDQGMEILKSHIKELREKFFDKMPGLDAFKLYDTYGFPFELMQEILEEEGFHLDDKQFKDEMEKQRDRGRRAREETNYMGAGETVYNKLDVSLSTMFTGYSNQYENNAVITAIIVGNNICGTAVENDNVSIITDKSPLYAESGGQKGDRGTIKTETGEIEISDCIKVLGNKFAHIGRVVKGSIYANQTAEIYYDKKHRMDTARNHSATHLLQKALREILGTHVEQAGSYVAYDRLRFDFTHFEAVSKEDLQKIEDFVNELVLDNLPISITETSIDEARKMGAMALFGEKYGEVVRVVDMGGISVELCGGTHLTNTSQIGAFKIVSESGVAAGVRRIEALTGRHTVGYYKEIEGKLQSVGALLKSAPEGIFAKIQGIISQSRETARELDKLRAKLSGNAIDDILSAKENINGVDVITAYLTDMDINGMRTICDRIKDKIKSCVIIIIAGKDEKHNMIVTATDDIVTKGINCGTVIKEAATAMGGSGGGRPNMAQAGVKDISKKNDGLQKAKETIAKMIK